MPLFLIRVLEHIRARANETIDTSFIHISRAPNAWFFYAIFYSFSPPTPPFFDLFSYG